MMGRITGHASAGDCNLNQLAAVLDEMKAKGWKPKVIAGAKASAPVRSKAADHPSARKARAMWISLHQLGVVRDRRESALEAFAARQLKVERLQWADQGQVYKLIEALKAMAERAGWSQAGDLDAVKARLAALLARKAPGRCRLDAPRQIDLLAWPRSRPDAQHRASEAHEAWRPALPAPLPRVRHVPA